MFRRNNCVSSYRRSFIALKLLLSLSRLIDKLKSLVNSKKKKKNNIPPILYTKLMSYYCHHDELQSQ